MSKNQKHLTNPHDVSELHHEVEALYSIKESLKKEIQQLVIQKDELKEGMERILPTSISPLEQLEKWVKPTLNQWRRYLLQAYGKTKEWINILRYELRTDIEHLMAAFKPDETTGPLPAKLIVEPDISIAKPHIISRSHRPIIEKTVSTERKIISPTKIIYKDLPKVFNTKSAEDASPEIISDDDIHKAFERARESLSRAHALLAKR